MKRLLMIAVLLSGCAPIQFENAGSQNKFEDDKYDCQVMLGYRGAPRIDNTSKQLADIIVNARDEMQRCLERKGWRVKS